jgi:hypothetical protein
VQASRKAIAAYGQAFEEIRVAQNPAAAQDFKNNVQAFAQAHLQDRGYCGVSALFSMTLMVTHFGNQYAIKKHVLCEQCGWRPALRGGQYRSPQTFTPK